MLIKRCPACGSEFMTSLEHCLDCATSLGDPIQSADVVTSAAPEAQHGPSDVDVVGTDLEAFSAANWAELTGRLEAGEIAFEREGTLLWVSAADAEETLDAVESVQELLTTGPPETSVVESRAGMPAGAAIRSVAGYIDATVLMPAVVLLSVTSGPVVATIAYLAGVLGLVCSEWRYGTSPGKRLLRLQVTGGDLQLTFRQALVRKTWLMPQLIPLPDAGYLAAAAVVVVTLATIGASQNNRGWHDRLAGTSVVRSH